MSSHYSRCVTSPTLKIATLAVGLAFVGSASAVTFTTENGVSGSFDTVFSYGHSVRQEAPASSLIGIANGGTSRSVNEDDGTRNYKKGDPFASVFKGTHELDLKYQNWGFFARGTYFVDFENRHNEKLGPLGKERVGRDQKMLDVFLTTNLDVYGQKIRVRGGNQVISWGESTFIPNSINSINPVDLVKIRTPGSEVKEAFLPTSSILISTSLTKNASVEGYVLFNHDKTKLDPRGSYWSNNDFASDDADRVFVGFGRRGDLTGVAARNPLPPTTPQIGATAQSLYGVFSPAAQVWALRGPDRTPSDHGQYGLSLRYLAPELNNTEFGLYYQNYHSRIPLFSGIKGTVASILTGGPLGVPTGQTGSATYFAEYPENIRLYGLSFNTAGPFGTALQGEYSYRPNQPLQYSTPELLLAALGAPNLITGYVTIPGTVSATLPFGASAAGLVPNGTFQQGWDRVKMSQFQMTATKSMPNIFGAEQGVLVGEVGYTKYHGLRQDVKFNGPAVFLPATSQGAIASQSGGQQTEGFITDSSWGYRLVGRLEYANIIYGGNLAPRIAYNHDVSGTSQTFNEGVKSTAFGLNYDYQKKFTVDLSYNMFYGGRKYCGTDTLVNPAAQTTLAAQLAGVAALGFPAQPATYCSSANPLRDRDFVSLVLTYAF